MEGCTNPTKWRGEHTRNPGNPDVKNPKGNRPLGIGCVRRSHTGMLEGSNL